jgi:hypothetical protein
LPPEAEPESEGDVTDADSHPRSTGSNQGVC